jgi:hypothetical protein
LTPWNFYFIFTRKSMIIIISWSTMVLSCKEWDYSIVAYKELWSFSTFQLHIFTKKCFFILINAETNPRVKYSISFERAPGMVGSNNFFFKLHNLPTINGHYKNLNIICLKWSGIIKFPNSWNIFEHPGTNLRNSPKCPNFVGSIKKFLCFPKLPKSFV